MLFQKHSPNYFSGALSAGRGEKTRTLYGNQLFMYGIFVCRRIGGADREKWDVSPFVRLYENLSKDVGELSGK